MARVGWATARWALAALLGAALFYGGGMRGEEVQALRVRASMQHLLDLSSVENGVEHDVGLLAPTTGNGAVAHGFSSTSGSRITPPSSSFSAIAGAAEASSPAGAGGALTVVAVPSAAEQPTEPAWRAWERCWQQGSWQWRARDSDSMQRDNAIAFRAFGTVDKWDNYTWEVIPRSGCEPYYAYNRAHFCRLLSGRDVLLIGDSISQLFRSALFNMAGALLPSSDRPVPLNRHPYRKPIDDDLLVCEDSAPSRVSMLSNWAIGNLRLRDELEFVRITDHCARHHSCHNINVTRGSSDDRIWGVDEFVGGYVSAAGLQPGLIVINAGAHYQEDGALLSQVRAALAATVAANPSATVVWRNTPPGHVNCSRIRTPLASPQPLELLPYHWGDFARQNALVAELIAREFPGVSYLDVATSTALRGDFHISAMQRQPPDDSDCMRYDEPGPMDHWVRGLYNVMLRAEGRSVFLPAAHSASGSAMPASASISARGSTPPASFSASGLVSIPPSASVSVSARGLTPPATGSIRGSIAASSTCTSCLAPATTSSFSSLTSSPFPCFGMKCRLVGATFQGGGLFFHVRNVCANMSHLVIQPTSVEDERKLMWEWDYCCTGTSWRSWRWEHGCHLPDRGTHVCAPMQVFGINVLIGRAIEYDASKMLGGSSFLLDTYVPEWYQFGHAMSKFVQYWSLDEDFDHVVINRNGYFPGERVGHYAGEAHIGVIFNLTVRDKVVKSGSALHLVGRAPPLCMRSMTHALNPESVFFHTRAAQRWRETVLRDKLDIPLRVCPPARAAILKRYEGSSVRGFTNEHVIDEVAAEFGISHVDRVSIGSRNTTSEQARLFNSIGLLFTTHTSQTKNLIFSAAHTAVVEFTARFLHGRVSGQSEGLEFLNVTFVSSKNHRVNVTNRCDRPDNQDVHCRLTINATILRESLSQALVAQKAACPGMQYA